MSGVGAGFGDHSVMRTLPQIRTRVSGTGREIHYLEDTSAKYQKCVKKKKKGKFTTPTAFSSTNSHAPAHLRCDDLRGCQARRF